MSNVTVTRWETIGGQQFAIFSDGSKAKVGAAPAARLAAPAPMLTEQARLDAWIERQFSAERFGDAGEPASEPVITKSGATLTVKAQDLIVARCVRDHAVMQSAEAQARPAAAKTLLSRYRDQPEASANSLIGALRGIPEEPKVVVPVAQAPADAKEARLAELRIGAAHFNVERGTASPDDIRVMRQARLAKIASDDPRREARLVEIQRGTAAFNRSRGYR